MQEEKYEVIITNTAEKQINKLHKNKEIRQMIRSKINELVNFPNVSDVKKLTDKNEKWRLAYKQYRIIFSIKAQTITILKVCTREEGYTDKS